MKIASGAASKPWCLGLEDTSNSGWPGTDWIEDILLGMFRDTPAARRLVAYLTTAKAQERWIRRAGGGAFSLNRSVPPSDYPDPLSRRIAQTLASARTVRFDGSDSMPTVMAAAFDHAVLEYVTDPTAGRLDTILASLDKVRRTTRFTT